MPLFSRVPLRLFRFALFSLCAFFALRFLRFFRIALFSLCAFYALRFLRFALFTLCAFFALRFLRFAKPLCAGTRAQGFGGLEFSASGAGRRPTPRNGPGGGRGSSRAKVARNIGPGLERDRRIRNPGIQDIGCAGPLSARYALRFSLRFALFTLCAFYAVRFFRLALFTRCVFFA